MSLLIVLIFDGLSLLFLAVIFLWTGILGIKYLSFDGSAVVTAIVVLCVAETVFVLMRGGHFVRNMLAKSTHLASEKEVRWIMGIQSLGGVGVCLGAILRGSPFAITFVTGLAVLGSLLILPFSVIILYQVFIMVWDWKGRVGNHAK